MTNYNFDRVAAQYDATRAFPPEVRERICTWMLARLPADPAITEIGVGTGRIAVPFIERGVRYSGFDISQAMLDLLQAKIGDRPNAILAIADITQPLPLPEQSQDTVIAVQILHLVDSVKALEQVRRVLKPHGALIWGWIEHGAQAPNSQIRPQFKAFVKELGGAFRTDYNQQPARDLLARWGARASHHTVAVWQGHETPRQAIDPLRQKVMSSTWHIPDEILAEAAARTEAWAVAEYGDLDRPLAYELSFGVDWYQF